MDRASPKASYSVTDAIFAVSAAVTVYLKFLPEPFLWKLAWSLLLPGALGLLRGRPAQVACCLGVLSALAACLPEPSWLAGGVHYEAGIGAWLKSVGTCFKELACLVAPGFVVCAMLRLWEVPGILASTGAPQALAGEGQPPQTPWSEPLEQAGWDFIRWRGEPCSQVVVSSSLSAPVEMPGRPGLSESDGPLTSSTEEALAGSGLHLRSSNLLLWHVSSSLDCGRSTSAAWPGAS
jgi:hypothetical protein